MKKLFAVCLLLLSFQLQAQTFTGRVLDAQTRQPVAFASIGILHREAGTVASEQGNFTLTAGKANPTDTLKISMIGYESQQFLLSQFETVLSRNQGIISLQPKTWKLKEVVIKPKKTKTLIVGNTTNSRSLELGFTSNDLGSEIGTVLRYNKKKPGHLLNVNFNISDNQYDNLIFRVNLYRFKDGKVGESLLQEPLYLETMIGHGTATLDLSEQNIYLDGDALLTLEWIKDYGKMGLRFSAGFFNADSYARKISQGVWHKLPAGIGFWATIEHEK